MSNPYAAPANPFGPPTGVHSGMPVQSTAQQTGDPFSSAPDDRITVGPFILSYPRLFVPRPKMGTPKPGETMPLQYSAELMVYASSPACQDIYAALLKAANAVAVRKFGRTIESLKNQPIRSLAEKNTPAAEPGFFITANTTQKPDVMVGDPSSPAKCDDPDDLYAGCLVYANLTPAAYDVDLSKGVKWYLNSILKVADGPRLAAERNPAGHYAHLAGKVQTNLAPKQAPPAAQQWGPPAGYQAPPAGYQAPPAGYQAPPAGYQAPPAGYQAPPAQPWGPPQQQAPPAQSWGPPQGQQPMPGHWVPPNGGSPQEQPPY